MFLNAAYVSTQSPSVHTSPSVPANAGIPPAKKNAFSVSFT